MAQPDRIVKPNRIAIQQMKILEDTGERKQFKQNDGTKEIHTGTTIDRHVPPNRWIRNS